MTTPGLDVYQLKRSRGVKHYSHILHAPDDATFYRLFGLDYFDSVLLTGEYQKKAIRELEKKRGIKEKELHVVGCTYLDILKSKINSLPVPEKKGLRVLVSPSWGDNGILKKYGLKLLKPLAESGLSVIIRPHPQSSISEKEVLDSLKISLQVFENIEWDFERENISSMNRSDVMISDFSGIIFDYFFLFGRPVLFTGFDFDKRAYDVSDVDEEPWKFRVLKEIGIELYEDRFHSIADLIETAVKDSSLKEKITEARNTAYQYPGMAGIRCADVIQDLLTRLNPKSSL
jgi:CDP-glycerol glycerophosphotransferase (TagB/SpsB family)